MRDSCIDISDFNDILEDFIRESKFTIYLGIKDNEMVCNALAMQKWQQGELRWLEILLVGQKK